MMKNRLFYGKSTTKFHYTNVNSHPDMLGFERLDRYILVLTYITIGTNNKTYQKQI